MCDLSYEDRASVFTVEHPKARKEHRCGCCRARIPPGEKYMRLSMIYDGTASTEKACAKCDEALTRFGAEHKFTPSPSSFDAYLGECVLWDEESRRKWAPTLQAINARLEANRGA